MECVGEIAALAVAVLHQGEQQAEEVRKAGGQRSQTAQQRPAAYSKLDWLYSAWRSPRPVCARHPATLLQHARRCHRACGRPHQPKAGAAASRCACSMAACASACWWPAWARGRWARRFEACALSWRRLLRVVR